MSSSCPICGTNSKSNVVQVRSGKEMELFHCEECDFDFFTLDPSKDLADDKLDESRLKSAGLDIPSIEKDFENGLKQSKVLIEEFIDDTDVNKNVLEIGCSVGYFLKLVQDRGANPYGIELNIGRVKYVNEHLDIPCHEDLAVYEKEGLTFKKIFLFYVLEYIPSPIAYFERLIGLLEEGGEIILVSPNLDDFLKDGWQNKAFDKFFYDEHAINYFTVKSMNRFAEKLSASNFVVSSRQGYSIVNHVSWFLTNAPRTTGIVGGDKFLKDINELLTTSGLSFSDEVVSLFNQFDQDYKKLLEENDYGNQIHLIIKK
jgi:SAM-dependent methyltransferase